jgi:hypothetical protein
VKERRSKKTAAGKTIRIREDENTKEIKTGGGNTNGAEERA